MAFAVTASVKGSTTVYELADVAGMVRAEVWPASGFNCLRWQLRQTDGSWGNILFAAADWESNPIPTRSGHPILFPFPGRLRDGQITAAGKTYQLPRNDSTKRHAIHGFTPRNPWRVVEVGGGNDYAFIRGEFGLREDLPSAASEWPADFNLSVTYTLRADSLRVDVAVENLGPDPLPFGLGFHPYFRLPDVPDADIGSHEFQANVAEVWAVDADNLPTGARTPLPSELDFRAAKGIGAVALDHIFTGITAIPTTPSGLIRLATLSHPRSSGSLEISADSQFRELVAFIPPHRRAIAIEPYTCAADAANLAARGVDSGWQQLGIGARWHAAVEYRWKLR